MNTNSLKMSLKEDRQALGINKNKVTFWILLLKIAEFLKQVGEGKEQLC